MKDEIRDILWPIGLTLVGAWVFYHLAQDMMRGLLTLTGIF